jgi:hypothetical protein
MTNITIDDSCSCIVYQGAWEVTTSPKAYGGSHHFIDTDVDPNGHTATATFVFTGNY